MIQLTKGPDKTCFKPNIWTELRRLWASSPTIVAAAADEQDDEWEEDWLRLELELAFDFWAFIGN